MTNQRRWSWLLLLASGALAYLLVLETLLITDNLNFVPSLLLLGSLVVPVALLDFAATRGDHRTRPILLVGVAVSGGVIGTVAAGVVEYDVLQQLDGLPALAVAVIEETAKLVVPVVVLLIARGRPRSSGVLVGMASGTGFASLETMGYGLQALLGTGDITAVDDTLLLRGLLSPAGHIAWTGMVTAALWRLPIARHPWRAFAHAGLIFVLVVGLHALWDSSNSAVVHVGIGLVSVAGLVAFLGHTRRDRINCRLDGAADRCANVVDQHHRNQRTHREHGRGRSEHEPHLVQPEGL